MIMTNLVEYIADLQLKLAIYGNVEVVGGGDDNASVFTDVSVMTYKDIHCECTSKSIYVSEEDHRKRLEFNETRQQSVQEIAVIWNNLHEGIRRSWGSYDRYLQTMMQPILINDEVLCKWDTTPWTLLL